MTTTDAAAPTIAEPIASAAAPKATTITATSSPSSETPLNVRKAPVQSKPSGTSSSTSSSPTPVDHPSRETIRMPLRYHCEPNASRSAPTTRRSVSSDRPSSAAPRAATVTTSTRRPPAAPTRAARHERVTPTATTIATISITSIDAARNVEMKTPQFIGSDSRGCASSS